MSLITRRDAIKATAGLATGIALASGAGTVAASSEDARIDIKPGSWPNSINPNANGVIPVALLEVFNSRITVQGDAAITGDGIEVLLDEGKPNERTVTVALPRFAPLDVFDRNGNGDITTNEVERALTNGLGIPPLRASVEDVDGDGDNDLIVHFDKEAFFDMVSDVSMNDRFDAALIGVIEWPETTPGSDGRRLFDGADEIRIVGGGRGGDRGRP